MLTVGMILSVRGAILPAMLEDLGLSYTVAGTLGLISPLAYVLTTLLSGYLVDHRGTRAIMLLGLVAGGVGMLAFSVSKPSRTSSRRSS